MDQERTLDFRDHSGWFSVVEKLPNEALFVAELVGNRKHLQTYSGRGHGLAKHLLRPGTSREKPCLTVL